MNYQEFRAYRDQVTGQPLLRLDCMNPFKAMNFLKSEFSNPTQRSSDDVLDLWVETMGVKEYRNIAISSGGVRESLRGLFNIFAANGKELWIPKDVYPFYWETAYSAGLKPRSFPTLPKPNLEVLDQASIDSVVVITNPVSPLGRTLNKEETTKIKEWLNGSKYRQVILDTVYSYTRGFAASTIELFETDQCFVLHSLSKAWLERGIFGVLLAPEKSLNICKNTLMSPPEDACSSAFAALEKQNNLSVVQQRAFSQEWARLTPAIQKISPDFQAPKTGYFTVIEANHGDVLEDHGALAIPATVFGSGNPYVSVVSCLYDISL